VSISVLLQSVGCSKHIGHIPICQSSASSAGFTGE
jgi:hypothetical protein